MSDKLDEEIDQYSLKFSQYSKVFDRLKYDEEKERRTRNYYKKRECALRNIKKILSTKRITEQLSDDEIESLLNGIVEDIESRELFEKILEIVKDSYGEKAENILRDRGELSLEDIPNFDIFDNKIMDTIGLGGVHSFLTYYMESEKVITEMAKKPELLELYKEFEQMTDTYFPPSAIGLEDKLNAFYTYKELIAEIVEQGRQEELKDNFKLLLRDDEIKYNRSYLNGFDPKPDEINIESLSNYRETRKVKINEQIAEQIYSGDVRNLIKFKFFGCLQNLPGQYNKYDHKKFLNDYLSFNHSEFSTDEVDLIELYSIIDDIEDIDILKKLNEELDKQKDRVLDPVNMKSIDNKVVESYKREYLESLLTVEKAKEMIDNPNNMSYKVILKANGDIAYEDHIKKANGDMVYEDYIEKKCGDKVYKNHIEKANGDMVYKDRIEKKEETEYLYKDGYSKRVHTTGAILYSCNGEGIFSDSKSAKVVSSLNYDFKRDLEQAILQKSEGRKNIYNYRLKNSKDIFRFKEDGTTTIRISMGDVIENDISPETEQIKSIMKVVEEKYTDDKLIAPFEEPEFFKPEMFEKLEEGDAEQFILYGVESKNLMISGIRNGATSTALQNKKLILSNSEQGGTKFRDSTENRIYIEKNLEGGISTRSFYYKPESSMFGLAFTSVDANSIVGFFPKDAGTTHAVKSLNPSMSAERISSILDQKVGIVAEAPEIVTLRYEYDISKIKEGTKGGKVEPDYIVSDNHQDISKLRKWAVAFSKPIIALGEIEKQDVISQEPKRVKTDSQFITDIRKIAESRKMRDIQSTAQELRTGYLTKEQKIKEDGNEK